MIARNRPYGATLVTPESVFRINDMNILRFIELTLKASNLHFTPRERVIVYFLLKGYDYNKIATLCKLKKRTIDSHVLNAKHKISIATGKKISMPNCLGYFVTQMKKHDCLIYTELIQATE
jgi:DNA-binding NarL/FixJ family response regulator